jgi:hypothetical protein
MVARSAGACLWALVGCIGLLTPIEMGILFFAISFDDKGGAPYFPLLFTPLLAPLLLAILWAGAAAIWGDKLASRAVPWAVSCGVVIGFVLLAYQMSRMPFFR